MIVVALKRHKQAQMLQACCLCESRNMQQYSADLFEDVLPEETLPLVQLLLAAKVSIQGLQGSRKCLPMVCVPANACLAPASNFPGLLLVLDSQTTHGHSVHIFTAETAHTDSLAPKGTLPSVTYCLSTRCVNQ